MKLDPKTRKRLEHVIYVLGTDSRGLPFDFEQAAKDIRTLMEAVG